MSAKSENKVLSQRAMPYKLYMGLTFTTIWLETIDFERKCWGSAIDSGAFFLEEQLYAKHKRLRKCFPSTFKY